MDISPATIDALDRQDPMRTAGSVLARGRLPRWQAGLEVFLVCGLPTQLVIAGVLAFVLGMPFVLPTESGELLIPLEFIATVSFLDTAVIALLIRFFLALSGEHSRDVFIGSRPILGEMLRGLALLPVVFLLVAGVVLSLRAVAPWLHNVDTNPLEMYMRSPGDAAIFVVIVILAGGVREELQRAFILHRFDQRLGGINVGLAVFTLAFGLMHFEQGFDVAIAVGLLGLVWGLFYIKRRSAVLAMTNHAAFNTVQVVQVVVVRALGA